MIIVVMGVTGCGKSTLGEELASQLGVSFHDADDYHPAANRAKLQSNIPLDDDDRHPWLLSLAANMPGWEQSGGAVLACSALKKKYRDLLRTGSADMVFVYIRGDAATIAGRLKQRAVVGHDLIRDYDQILAGQFRDFEEPEDAVVVSNLLAPSEMADEAMRQLSVRGIKPRKKS